MSYRCGAGGGEDGSNQIKILEEELRSTRELNINLENQLRESKVTMETMEVELFETRLRLDEMKVEKLHWETSDTKLSCEVWRREVGLKMEEVVEQTQRVEQLTGEISELKLKEQRNNKITEDLRRSLREEIERRQNMDDREGLVGIKDDGIKK
ncbi:uncharacterized protein LOC113475593 [Ciona intestinalis]